MTSPPARRSAQNCPPSRRLRSIQSVEQSYLDEGRPQLDIPIRQVDLWSIENRSHPTLTEYFSGCEEFSSAETRGKLLFHSCANRIDEALLASFSKRGPSIRFARPRGYLSQHPAVYWTDSLDFAFAWGVFTETGRWIPNITKETFSIECLIYVSKVDFSVVNAPFGVHIIPHPIDQDSERILDNWCHGNMETGANRNRNVPPGTSQAEWSLIGSRIPSQTIHALHEVEAVDLPALGRTDLPLVNMYAACDEITSQGLARSGVEILHILSSPLRYKL